MVQPGMRQLLAESCEIAGLVEQRQSVIGTFCHHFISRAPPGLAKMKMASPWRQHAVPGDHIRQARRLQRDMVEHGNVGLGR